MADVKISGLPASTTPLAGTEVLPIVQSGVTKKVSVANLTFGRAVEVASLASSTSLTSGTAGGNNGSVILKRASDGLTVQTMAVNSAVSAIDYTTAYPFHRFFNYTGQVLGVGDGGANNNVTVNTGNLVIGTSGKGIDFSVTPNPAGMTSELLADYEEGTFTPTIAGSTSAGTASYAAQSGTYTKVGRLVTFQVYLSWSSGTGTGDLYVSGLPFTSSAAPFGVATTAYQANIALTASNFSNGGYVLSSGSSVRLMQTPVAGGAAAAVPYDAAGEFMMAGSYYV